MLFTGSIGVGKTHLAVGVLRRLVQERGVRGLFATTANCLRTSRTATTPRSTPPNSSCSSPSSPPKSWYSTTWARKNPMSGYGIPSHLSSTRATTTSNPPSSPQITLIYRPAAEMPPMPNAPLANRPSAIASATACAPASPRCACGANDRQGFSPNRSPTREVRLRPCRFILPIFHRVKNCVRPSKSSDSSPWPRWSGLTWTRSTVANRFPTVSLRISTPRNPNGWGSPPDCS